MFREYLNEIKTKAKAVHGTSKEPKFSNLEKGDSFVVKYKNKELNGVFGGFVEKNSGKEFNNQRDLFKEYGVTNVSNLYNATLDIGMKFSTDKLPMDDYGYLTNKGWSIGSGSDKITLISITAS